MLIRLVQERKVHCWSYLILDSFFASIAFTASATGAGLGCSITAEVEVTSAEVNTAGGEAAGLVSGCAVSAIAGAIDAVSGVASVVSSSRPNDAMTAFLSSGFDSNKSSSQTCSG